VTSITTVVEGLNVKISWIEPNIRGSSLNQYTITIKNKAGQFVQDAVNCVGSTPSIIDNSYCEISMLDL
jgi:hypothetical protein